MESTVLRQFSVGLLMAIQNPMRNLGVDKDDITQEQFTRNHEIAMQGIAGLGYKRRPR